MPKYRKLFLAAMLFCMSVYAVISAVWHSQNGDRFTAGIILIGVLVAVVTIMALIDSAEGMRPYNDLEIEKRRTLVLSRALRLYANGHDDAGAFAADILRRIKWQSE